MKLIHILGPAMLYTNTFLVLTEAGHAIAIDPAADPQEYLDMLEKHHVVLTHILLTHGHYDHVGAVKALKAATGAKVYLEPADCRGDRMYPLAEADAAYPADGKLSIDELTFTVWRTPGHTPGSVCLYCNGLLFSGDTLFAGSCGRTDLPGGSSADMRRSLSLLAGLPLLDQTQVLPGHGGDSTMGEEKRQNPYLLGVWL